MVFFSSFFFLFLFSSSPWSWVFLSISGLYFRYYPFSSLLSLDDGRVNVSSGKSVYTRRVPLPLLMLLQHLCNERRKKEDSVPSLIQFLNHRGKKIQSVSFSSPPLLLSLLVTQCVEVTDALKSAIWTQARLSRE
jgi:hypothetical protein